MPDLMLRALLIVPYGIETCEAVGEGGAERRLLIVPYGIETYYYTLSAADTGTFNRTLWN